MNHSQRQCRKTPSRLSAENSLSESNRCCYLLLQTSTCNVNAFCINQRPAGYLQQNSAGMHRQINSRGSDNTPALIGEYARTNMGWPSVPKDGTPIYLQMGSPRHSFCSRSLQLGDSVSSRNRFSRRLFSPPPELAQTLMVSLIASNFNLPRTQASPSRTDAMLVNGAYQMVSGRASPSLMVILTFVHSKTL